jgi:hypothetical protein
MEGSTYQVVVISMVAICGLLRLFLLAALPPPKDSAVAPIEGVYHLHQRVNGHEEAGQQRTASSRPELSDELLVVPDCKQNWQKLLQH